MMATHVDDFIGIRRLGLDVTTRSYNLDTRPCRPTEAVDAEEAVDRCRSALKHLASECRRVYLGLLVGEVCHELQIATVSELRARAERVWELVGQVVDDEVAAGWEEADAAHRTHDATPSDPIPSMVVLDAVARRVHDTITPSLLHLRWVDPEAIHRVERMVEGIRAFIARGDLPARERGLGAQYQRAELSIHQLADALGVDVPSAVVFVERQGFKRSLRTLPTQGDAWRELLGELFELQQRGALRSTRETRRREVIASQRIEGIDARSALADEVASSVPK